MSDRLDMLTRVLGLNSQDTSRLRWWVLPNPKNPRLVIPLDSQFWKPAIGLISTKSRRILLRLLLFFYSFVGKKPDLYLESIPACLKQGELGGDIVNFVVKVSTSNRFSKYTLSLLNTRGDPLAYAKISEKPGGASAIESEAKALRFLAKTDLPKKCFPALIHFEPDLSIQSASPKGGHGQLDFKCGRIAHRLFSHHKTEVEWAFSKTKKSICESSKRIDQLGFHQLSSELNRFSESLGSMWGASTFWEGFTHGDLIRWNAQDTASGFLYDWEWMGIRSEFHDFFHYLWFPMLQKEVILKSDDLWAAMDSKTGKSFLKGYGSEEDQKDRKRGLNYLLRSYSFYTEHCILNGEEPKDYSFLEQIRRLLVETFGDSNQKTSGMTRKD